MNYYYRSILILCLFSLLSSTNLYSMQTLLNQTSWFSNLDVSSFMNSCFASVSSCLPHLSIDTNYLTNSLSENKTTVAIVGAGLILSSCCACLWHQNTQINKLNLEKIKREEEIEKAGKKSADEFNKVVEENQTLFEKTEKLQRTIEQLEQNQNQ